MNIIEAFNKLDDEHHKTTIKHKDMKFIKIYGDLYRSSYNTFYKHILRNQVVFTYEEIMSTDWEVVE